MEEQEVGAKRKALEEPNLVIDRKLIPHEELQEQFQGDLLKDLLDLGVQAYDPDAMEKNVLEQVFARLNPARRGRPTTGSRGEVETGRENSGPTGKDSASRERERRQYC